MAFGRGATTENAAAGELAFRLKPTELLRALALRALERIVGPASELASL
jgi:hypothetical protein